MTDSSTDASSGLVGTHTKITAVFVVLGVACWYVAMGLTDSDLLRFAVLFGVGVLAPTVVNAWRS